MADLVYVLVVVAFFALTALFVVGCDRIIGPDEVPESVGDVDAEPAAVPVR